jgi:hypothetical protein
MVRRFNDPCSSILFRAAASLFLLILLLGIDPSATSAQRDGEDIAPPPLKLLSREEIAELEKVSGVSARTKLALQLMEARVLKAEEHRSREEWDEMFKQLGSFHGLMDNTLDFLSNSDRDKGKVLGNLKKLEIELRKFRPRLEVLRREVPLRYERYVRNLITYLRDARAQAVEPLFSDTVVPQRKP